MRQLEPKEMESIEGGGVWDCLSGGVGMGVVIGVGMSALMGNPLAIAAIVRSPGAYANLMSGSAAALALCWTDQ